MTEKYELTKMYHRKEIIPVCVVSYHKYQRGEVNQLEHLINGEVMLQKPIVPNYKHYSHGICKPCMKELYEGV